MSLGGEQKILMRRRSVGFFFRETFGYTYLGNWRGHSVAAALCEKSVLEFAAPLEEEMKAEAIREVHRSYASRIEFLREEATVESMTFNKDSERDFWTFIGSIPFVRRGNLFLMDNGDLRVVWDDDEDNLVGLQFLGNSLARYVIFKRRAEDEAVSHVAGTDTLKGVNTQIEAFKLETLLSL